MAPMLHFTTPSIACLACSISGRDLALRVSRRVYKYRLLEAYH
jgi:hypothetical protein